MVTSPNAGRTLFLVRNLLAENSPAPAGPWSNHDIELQERYDKCRRPAPAPIPPHRRHRGMKLPERGIAPGSAPVKEASRFGGFVSSLDG